jgi:hypothetical protein
VKLWVFYKGRLTGSIGCLLLDGGLCQYKINKRSGVMMSDRKEILDELMQVIGKEGCGVACKETTVP